MRYRAISVLFSSLFKSETASLPATGIGALPSCPLFPRREASCQLPFSPEPNKAFYQFLCDFVHPVFNFKAKMVNKHITPKVKSAMFSNFPECHALLSLICWQLSFFSSYPSYHSTLISNSFSGVFYQVALFLNKRKTITAGLDTNNFCSAQFKRWMPSNIFSSE